MQTRRKEIFTTVRTEGGILPADLLQRIVSADKSLEGLTAESYHLAPGEKINEAVNRAWNRLQGSWEAFRAAAEKLPAGDPGTSATRERWLLPLFQELGYGRLRTAAAIDIDGKSYAISHSWGQTPIHLVGCLVDMDRPTRGVAGAARSSPHSLTQELLNRSDGHLWAFVSNGKRLRILRNNKSLTRQSYVEFDLEAMLEGEAYADFVLLWLLCHQSRVEAERPEQCWLEKWSQSAQEQGTRALDQLRDGVEQAITALGKGFLTHPANRLLRENLRAGSLSTQDYYRQLLRVVYRLLFLFVAEDRELLLDPNAPQEAKNRYLRYYATSRLRRMAERQRGTRHSDLYQGLRLVLDHLYSGCPELALPALGGFLFSPQASADLNACELANNDMLDAMRVLAFTIDGKMRRPVDYKNLRSEELGSVYEALLEQHPELSVDAGTFSLRTAGGSERKTTGSYYTPDSLVQCLLDSALDPVLDEAVKKPNPEQAILDLKVCDPACGSGHFLIAAAHRMAKRLASVRTGDEEPSPEATRTALRDIIGHCVYGVDLNPMAVELCKVALWMEALEPGKPLSFLEHHVQCGNSLLGTTPALLRDGIPEAAFTPIEGDNKEFVSECKKRHKREYAERAQGAFDDSGAWGEVSVFAKRYALVSEVDDGEIEGVNERASRYAKALGSEEALHARLWHDAWCAAFVWKKRQDGRTPFPMTERTFQALMRRPGDASREAAEEIERLAEQYRFFHWHLAFPDVFRTESVPSSPDQGWSGGFDVVLGNPPWERVKLQEKEWFAVRSPEIANAANASMRQKMIAALKTDDPTLYNAFMEDRRQAEGESQLMRHSGKYPLCGRGDVNTYAVFAELFRSLLSPTGRAGIIVPTGIATDDTTKAFFADLTDTRTLGGLYDFENRKGLFPAVDSRMKFCVLTMNGSRRPAETGAEFVFFAHSTEDLRDPERRFTLSAQDIALLNPNTKTCPVFRSRRDAEITKGIYRRVPVLINEAQHVNIWGIEFMRMLDMANDSGLFLSEPTEDSLPLYEAKMLHQFNHRWATYDGADTRDTTLAERRNASYAVTPRYWVESAEVEKRLKKRDRDGNVIWEWEHGWLLGWRDICRSTDERTVIASVLPRVGVGHKFPLMLPANDSALAASCLVANLTSFALDYAARQKVGGTSMTYFYLKQLPVLPPEQYSLSSLVITPSTWGEWIAPRVLELAFTAWDMELFARDYGYDGAPFVWDEKRRFLLRCELDAAYFHLYGVARDDVDYIMETFPIVKRKDEAEHGEYRTKRVILEIYDAMQQAIETCVPYQTRLDPPPANGWTPPQELLQAAFTAPATNTPITRQPTAVHEDPDAFELAPPPSLPKPLRDKDGEILRVRVYNESEEVILSRGVAVGRKKEGEITTWSILAEGESAPRQFQSPPAVLKRLKAR